MSNKSNIKGNNPLQKTRVLFKGNFITLRGRTGIKGESLYLDYYISENGRKERKYEFLKKLELKYSLPKIQREENIKLAVLLAEGKDAKLKAGEYDQLTDYSLKVDFIKYFENYIKYYKKNDVRMFISILKHFVSFLETKGLKTIQGKDIKEGLIYDFKEYLVNNDRLTGETPSSYLKRFKKLLKQAKRDNVIKGDPASEITIKNNHNTITKDVLTLEELTILKNTPCINDNIRRAFLFSAMTGLRFVDVRLIKWGNINQGALKINQEKTGNDVIITLNNSALEMAGLSGEPENKIFDLPSFSYCMRALKEWKNKAGLAKHITWHVSRHSFATNLLIMGTDIKTTAGLLGHSDLDHVNRYVRLVDSLKLKAVNSIEI